MLSRSLSTFLQIISLYETFIYAKYCSEESRPETIFNIGTNIYINTHFKTLWLLNRNNGENWTFSEVKIKETFGDRFNRIDLGFVLNLTDCEKGCEKLKDLAIVVGYDNSGKKFYSTFRLKSDGKLTQLSQSDLPEDWDLEVFGHSDTQYDRFWGVFSMDDEIADLFSASQMVFVKIRHMRDIISYKPINKNGSLTKDWTVMDISKNNFYGKSTFQMDQDFYDIRKIEDKRVSIVINRKFKVNVNKDLKVEIVDDPNFETVDHMVFFKCRSPIPPASAAKETISDSKPSCNKSSFIIIIVGLLLLNLITIIICCVWNCFKNKNNTETTTDTPVTSVKSIAVKSKAPNSSVHESNQMQSEIAPSGSSKPSGISKTEKSKAPNTSFRESNQMHSEIKPNGSSKPSGISKTEKSKVPNTSFRESNQMQSEITPNVSSKPSGISKTENNSKISRSPSGAPRRSHH